MTSHRSTELLLQGLHKVGGLSHVAEFKNVVLAEVLLQNEHKRRGSSLPEAVRACVLWSVLFVASA